MTVLHIDLKLCVNDPRYFGSGKLTKCKCWCSKKLSSPETFESETPLCKHPFEKQALFYFVSNNLHIIFKSTDYVSATTSTKLLKMEAVVCTE